jgi:hypothetical protein
MKYLPKTHVPGPQILKAQIEAIVETSDMVCAAGVDPRPGKPVTIDVVDICRFADGKFGRTLGDAKIGFVFFTRSGRCRLNPTKVTRSPDLSRCDFRNGHRVTLALSRSSPDFSQLQRCHHLAAITLERRRSPAGNVGYASRLLARCNSTFSSRCRRLTSSFSETE